MIWFIANFQRFRAEREALERLAERSPWLVPIGFRIDDQRRLLWDADIGVSGEVREVTLRYPHYFPHSLPSVLPHDPNSKVRWSPHQYGPGGELCLEYGPDNWHPDLTGAHMIESAYRLLQGETPAPGETAVVASRHSTTLGQNLRWERRRLLLTRELCDRAVTIYEQERVPGTILTSFHEECAVSVVASLKLPGGEWTDSTIPQPMRAEGYPSGMVLLRWPMELELPPTQSAKAFREAIGATDEASLKVKHWIIAQGAHLHGFLLRDEEGGNVTKHAIVPQEQVAERLDADHASLATRTVAVVGCGSLGSKLAVMLARSGVGTFLLVDDDVLLPENLVRNELDWREMGTHKAAAVARNIQLVNPHAQCQTELHRLGGQQSGGSLEAVIGGLAGADLIIDATSNGNAFNYICAAVSVGKKPVVWAEVYGGGIGGLIARHRPELEPDPATMRLMIENWCREQGKPIARGTDYATGGDGPPLIADDPDVTVIAAHAARLAIDTLIPRNPSIFPCSVYMIGLAGDWIFDQPFDTKPIDVGGPIPKPPPESLAPEIVNEEGIRVLKLFEQYAAAHPTPSDDPQAPAV